MSKRNHSKETLSPSFKRTIHVLCKREGKWQFRWNERFFELMVDLYFSVTRLHFDVAYAKWSGLVLSMIKQRDDHPQIQDQILAHVSYRDISYHPVPHLARMTKLDKTGRVMWSKMQPLRITDKEKETKMNDSISVVFPDLCIFFERDDYITFRDDAIAAHETLEKMLGRSRKDKMD